MKQQLKKIFLIISFCFCALYSLAQNRKEDSLWSVYNNKTQADTNRLKAIGVLAKNFLSNDPDTAIILAEQELQFAKKVNQKKYQSKALIILGTIFTTKGNYPKALGYYLESLKINEEINDEKGIGESYSYIGQVYNRQFNYPKALEYYLKALKIRLAISDKKGIGACFTNIGNVYYGQRDYNKALEFYLKALKMKEEIGDRIGIAGCYGNIGIAYQNQNPPNLDKALEYYFKQLLICEEIGDKKGTCLCYNNIGNVYADRSNHLKALEYYLKDLKIAKELDDKQEMGLCSANIGELYVDLLDYKKAIQYCDSSLQFSKAIGDINTERTDYQFLAIAYSKLNKYKEAYEYNVKFKQLTDSIFNEDNSKQLGDLKTQFEVEKKEAELNAKADAQQAIASEEKKRQEYVIYSVVGLLALVLVFAVFMFNRFKVTQKQKGIIEKQKHEVEEQKHLVEEKQKEIVDSIIYAKRLQQAILPSDEELNRYIPEHFLLYKPKDIVAGDFYWMEHLDETTYIAASDSTGHGVPGAIVSVVCSNALNRAVKEFGLRETGKILDKTRELVLETFAKSGEEIKDGMDISLLSINKKKKLIEWSGANNQLYYISHNQLLEIKPDKQPIGKTGNPIPFTTHHIEYVNEDVFYLMTDGYPDQFGGPKGKKFKYKQLEEKLLAMSNNDLNEQKKILESSFYQWKGDLEQVDDVCIIGIRL